MYAKIANDSRSSATQLFSLTVPLQLMTAVIYSLRVSLSSLYYGKAGVSTVTGKVEMFLIFISYFFQCKYVLPIEFSNIFRFLSEFYI